MISRTWICAALVSTIGSAYAQHPSAIDFRGVPMGADLSTWEKVLPFIPCTRSEQRPGDAVCDVRDIGGATSSLPGLSYGGFQARSVRAEFVNGKLGRITVLLRSNELSALLDALEVKFGRPTAVERPEFKTRGGLTTANLVSRWTAGPHSVVATLLAGSIDDGTVVYSDEAALLELKARRQRGAEHQAKQL